MSGSLVPTGPAAILTQVLGRAPTQQELIDLTPIAVMVQAFNATAQPGDELRFDYHQWHDSFLFGLAETSGQKAKLRIKRAES